MNDRTEDNQGVVGRDPTDPLLQNWVAAANEQDDDGFPVTLCVRGVILCGQITSAKRYFELLQGEFSAAASKHSAEAGKAAETLFAHEIDEVSKPAEGPPEFIHLRDAYAWQGRPMSASGCLWRGRLSSVDAFTVGVLLPPGREGEP